MNSPDIIDALIPLIHTLEKLNIAYYIGGSIASSAYGAFRATRDVDMVFHIKPQHVDALVRELESDYYIDKEMILDAIHRQASFNIIHLKTMFKIDGFVLKQRSYDQQAFQRKRKDYLSEEMAFSIFLASPEDTILSKLEWYKAGNLVSDRQWQDILGVMRVQKDRLDIAYLKKWGEQLGILDLLEKAFLETPVK